MKLLSISLIFSNIFNLKKFYSIKLLPGSDSSAQRIFRSTLPLSSISIALPLSQLHSPYCSPARSAALPPTLARRTSSWWYLITCALSLPFALVACLLGLSLLLPLLVVVAVVVLVAVCLFTLRSKFTHTSAAQAAKGLRVCLRVCVCVRQLQLRSVCCYNDFVVVVVVFLEWEWEWELKIGMLYWLRGQ